MISLIAAVSEDLGIGFRNELLWHLPGDLKRFRKLTTGKTVVMGKKTWESLPRKPLPGRKNVVITDVPFELFDGAIAAYSVEDAVGKCDKGEEIFIIGGGSIYRQFFPLADRLYITRVHGEAPADVFFPEIESGAWEIADQEKVETTSSGISYTFTIYDRKRKKK
jgi:dihydrofolate reductase